MTDIKSLIPPGHAIEATTEAELLFYGQATLQRLSDIWGDERGLLMRRAVPTQDIEQNRPTEEELKALKEAMNRITDTRDTLWLLAQRAEDKPVLPRYRSERWGKPYQTIMVYGDGWAILRKGWRGFVRGQILKNTGCGADVIQVYPFTGVGAQIEADPVFLPIACCEVMLVDEYVYLAKHPDFARAWAQHSDHNPAFEPSRKGAVEAALLNGGKVPKKYPR